MDWDAVIANQCAKYRFVRNNSQYKCRFLLEMMPWIAFKLAICIVLAHIFWHPQRLLDSIGARCDDDHILELTRQIMSILMTLLALLRPISSGLIVGMCYCVFPAVEKSNQLY